MADEEAFEEAEGAADNDLKRKRGDEAGPEEGGTGSRTPADRQRQQEEVSQAAAADAAEATASAASTLASIGQAAGGDGDEGHAASGGGSGAASPQGTTADSGDDGKSKAKGKERPTKSNRENLTDEDMHRLYELIEWHDEPSECRPKSNISWQALGEMFPKANGEPRKREVMRRYVQKSTAGWHGNVRHARDMYEEWRERQKEREEESLTRRGKRVTAAKKDREAEVENEKLLESRPSGLEELFLSNEADVAAFVQYGLKPLPAPLEPDLLKQTADKLEELRSKLTELEKKQDGGIKETVKGLRGEDVVLRLGGYEDFKLVTDYYKKGVRAEQLKSTVFIMGDELWVATMMVPSIASLFADALCQVEGKTRRVEGQRAIRAVQILFGGRSTQFLWHQDNSNYDEAYRDKLLEIEYTVIYNLTAKKTAMQIAGKDVYEYADYGGVLFLSELWHRSQGAEVGSVKVTVFVGKKQTSRSLTVASG